MSDILFPCPHCGVQIECDAASAGQAANCPSCQKALVIPAASAAAAPPAKPVLPPLPTAAVAAKPPAPPVAPKAPPPAGPPASPRVQTVGGAKKTPGVAVASLVLSLLGIAIGGVICGHIARGKIKRDPSLGGKGLATAGLIIGYIGLIVPLVAVAAVLAFAPNFLADLKAQMAGAGTTNEVTMADSGAGKTGDANPTTSEPPKKSSTKKSATSKPAVDTPEEAVKKVVQAYLDAEMKQDMETMKSLMTAKAQKNFTTMIPVVPTGGAGGLNLNLEKTEVNGETAKSLVRMSTPALRGMELGAYYRLKQEEGQWRLYAITVLMENDEPALTVDLEKGMQPIIEGDPAKMAAYFAKLNQSAKSGKKSGKTSTTRPPTTTRPVEPPPEVVKPVVKPPEKIEDLIIEGRKTPVSLTFGSFVGSTGVKAQVVNYSNKAVRRINVTLFYLDSGSSTLGQQSASLINNDPNIVARSGKAEVEFKASIPADARKAILELVELQFTDGTTWRPGQK